MHTVKIPESKGSRQGIATCENRGDLVYVRDAADDAEARATLVQRTIVDLEEPNTGGIEGTQECRIG